MWRPANYEFPSTKEVIDRLAYLSVNYIMLFSELNQESKESPSLTATYDLGRILKIMEYAKMQGMNVRRSFIYYCERWDLDR